MSEWAVIKGSGGKVGWPELDQVRAFVQVDYWRLVAALWTITGSREVAEDLVQEALARTLDYCRRGRRVHDFPAFVRSTAINLSRNRWRSLARERLAVRRLSDQAARAEPEQMAGAMDLHRAVLSLPRRERQAVALVYQLDLSVQEASLRMGVAPGTVKSLLSRARHHLAAIINDEESEARR